MNSENITIKIRRKIKEELETVKKEHDLSSLSDTIKLLMTINHFLVFVIDNIGIEKMLNIFNKKNDIEFNKLAQNIEIFNKNIKKLKLDKN